MLVDNWPHLHNQRSKQTNFVDFQFFSNYALFSKKLVPKVVKKRNLDYESVLYNSTELSVDWEYRKS